MSSFGHPIARPAALALVAGLLSAAAGLAFAGWMDHAPAIFVALVEQGMAWCF